MAEAGTTNHIWERDNMSYNIENFSILFYDMADMTQEQINKMLEFIAQGMSPDEAAKKAEEEGAK